MLDAPTTRSNRIDASVGAAGTNDRKRGWSTEMHAGASTSPKMRNASSPPIPLAVIVLPAIARNSVGVRGPSSGGGSSRTRSTAYRTIACVSTSVEESWRCISLPVALGASVRQREQLAALVADLTVALQEVADDGGHDPAGDQ